ncbi:hypothetical protein ACLG6S_06460 [Thermodesulfobacteriota bacterium B35]
MRGLWLFLVVLLAGLTTVHPAVAGPAAAEVTKNIPLPLAETERVLGRWLSDAGLTVAEDPLASGEMRITAHGAGVAWDIVLRADTPLATTARIRYSGDAADDSLAGLDRAVRDHLELSHATPAAEAGPFPCRCWSGSRPLSVSMPAAGAVSSSHRVSLSIPTA